MRFDTERDARLGITGGPAPLPPKRGGVRWPAVVAFLCLIALSTMGAASLILAGEGGQQPTTTTDGSRSGVAAGVKPTPSPVTNPYRPRPVARGVAGAVAAVIADVSDPVIGRSIMGTIFDSTQRVTGCTVIRVDVDTHETKREAREAAGKLGAFAAVEYAPPEWHDQFVSVIAEVTC